jgi:hypothetical protein
MLRHIRARARVRVLQEATLACGHQQIVVPVLLVLCDAVPAMFDAANVLCDAVTVLSRCFMVLAHAFSYPWCYVMLCDAVWCCVALSQCCVMLSRCCLILSQCYAMLHDAARGTYGRNSNTFTSTLLRRQCNSVPVLS